MVAADNVAPDRQENFNRFEYKYLVHQRRMPAIIDALEGYMVRDPHCDGDRGYLVRSVYWDSPQWDFFWEKVEGFKFRRKLRFRWYEDSADQIYVEIKQRMDRTIQKRRVRWPADQVRRVFDEHDDEGSERWAPVVAESLVLVNLYRLSPVMAVAYRRLAFHGVREPRLRLTLDTNTRYHRTMLGAGERFEDGEYIVDPQHAVMEIKFDDRVPRWLCRLAAMFELRLVRMSKYCRAVDRAHFGFRYT